MLTVYHSNHLETQKDILLHLIESQPLDNPLEAETLLVQSPGMAKWLQLQIADKLGVAANFQFPMPASFIWQQYCANLADVQQQSQFSKEAMMWHLLSLIPQCDLPLLKSYLSHSENAQANIYQLARNIADLFDQYLVYRPDWILYWEENNDELIFNQIREQFSEADSRLSQQIEQDIRWQGQLWRALIAQIRLVTGQQNLPHRAYLHRQYLAKLAEGKPENLPSRLFVFGISALPQSYLMYLQAISRYCDVHLFFTNPSKHYWGDIVDPQFLQKTYRTLYDKQEQIPLLTEQEAADFQQFYEQTQENERLLVGNPLLASWGKLGRDFLYLLTEIQPDRDIIFPVEHQESEQQETRLLNQIQQRILDLQPSQKNSLHWQETDHSVKIQACHSEMREVEVLYDYLLQLFQQNPDLTPKDVVVMTVNIEKYAPYVNAVFGQYYDNRQIPFSISDHKLSASDVLVGQFLKLLHLKDNQFSAEEVLAFLDVPAIRSKFGISLLDLDNIRYWVEHSGIRFGLEKYQENQQVNYNSWQAGLERLLLGNAMREEQGIWQDSLGFDNSYGLKGQLAGKLADFIDSLYRWHQLLQSAYEGSQWQQHLLQMIDEFFVSESHTQEILFLLKQKVNELAEQLAELKIDLPLEAEVVADVLTEKLDTQDAALTFLTGKVSFCTLLPMRSIPFKVVCLLGMNETDYPRQHQKNSFDLMQYHHKKGDRARRDDDRYLFLEALLSAEKYFYISYIGRSIVDNSVREPSVLVSQLLDYLQDNLDSIPFPQDEKGQRNDKLKPLVQYHSMQIFSPHNFNQKTHRTFAREWLPLLNRHQTESKVSTAFCCEMPSSISEEESQIALADLISFIQHPIKFFFEKQLGVYFREESDLINDSENFTLDGLQGYQINEKLLSVKSDNVQRFFEELQLKGVAPRYHFGEVYQHKFSQEIQAMQAALKEYEQADFVSEWAEFATEIEGKSVLLQGMIDRLLPQPKQRVSWYVSSFKDKYAIENWLVYLLQIATEANSVAPVFYCKEKDRAVKYSFKTVEKSTALSLLHSYITDYCRSKNSLFLVVTEDIKKYLALSIEDEIGQWNKIQALANGGFASSADLYWQRIIAQQTEFNFADIHQKTQDWFAIMYEHLVKE